MSTDDTWRLKFSQFRKKCFAFMGIVQYNLSERSERLLTKVVKWRRLAHEPIELKNGELG